MSEKDIIFSKINIIKNCLTAIEKASLQEKDPDFQLALFEINLQRAIQACIDIANVIISKEGLGLPNTYRHSFEILFKSSVIDSAISQQLIKMVGFRNISVHDYEVINPEIVKNIVTHQLKDLENYYSIIFKYIEKWN